MSIRSLSFGLGAGLLLATLVYGIGDYFLDKQQKVIPEQTAPAPLTPEQIRAQAEKQGMVALPKDEWEQQLAAARQEGAQQKAAELAPIQPQTPPQAPQKVFVYIPSGLSAGETALLLKTAGVIPDAAQFYQSLESADQPDSRRGL
jgi:hypothetical protein